MVTCEMCGATAAEAPLGWTRERPAPAAAGTGAPTRWYCERCSREHVRSMEGKLDPTWWA